jgi:glycosyltransferase involved in cell wall biosynthesis
MLDEMLDFFSVFLTYYPGSIFLFVTTDNAQEIFAKAQSRGVDQRFVRVRKASRSELPAILSLSTASIFFIIPTFSKMASSPTKMGELMGMGIPIICNTGVGDIARIMDDARAGIALEAFNTSAYQQACQQFDRIRALPAHHIKKGAATWYSLEEGVKRYAEVYRKLLHQTANSI